MLPFVFRDLHLSTSALEKPTLQTERCIPGLRLIGEASPVSLSDMASGYSVLLGEVCMLGF